MKINFRKLCFLVLLSAGWNSFSVASEPNLEDKMRALNMDDRAPVGTSQEKLYSVQTRLVPLKMASEFTIGASTSVAGDSFISSQELNFSYRLHFNETWAMGLATSSVANQLNSSATRLRSDTGLLPEVPYATSRQDLTVEANLYYGKFRLSSERVFYFDQYIALGASASHFNTGTVTAPVGDIGLTGYVARNVTTRIGIKDYYEDVAYVSGSTHVNNAFVHLDVGFIF